ncbi:hypothetical protein CIK74_05770 [Glutamicibacter sp. BW77]|nr:hypothetical protein CIK74_05770 [Glutamicibacter sp. BW77]
MQGAVSLDSSTMQLDDFGVDHCSGIQILSTQRPRRDQLCGVIYEQFHHRSNKMIFLRWQAYDQVGNA